MTVLRAPLAALLGASLAASLAACSDATPGALDSDATDLAAASGVWRDPWVAPTTAMAPGPGLGTNGRVTRVVGARTTSYDVPAEAAASAELAVATASGWAPTSSSCSGSVSVALAGPDGALASLVVTPSGGSAAASVVALTRHHLDDDWSVPDTIDRTCLDGGPSDLAELPESSEPVRAAELPDVDSAGWQTDGLDDDDAALLNEVNADLAAKGLPELPPMQLHTGENWRRAPAAQASVAADGLDAVGRTLEGWTLTWTACGGGAPTRATYVRSFDHGPAVAYVTVADTRASLRFTLPIPEAPVDDSVAGLAQLADTPCRGEVEELTVVGTPAVLPTELTPVAD
ncbi:hypothetical protein [Nocardioides astragali]|uniref:Uncharacterized protein n=1 Tax=Nocardioides astragali TaxID=1776736 RepID=A0ABW2MWS1_9ACTN|nr:hypothetical protein [Nocardioides astragali]